MLRFLMTCFCITLAGSLWAQDPVPQNDEVVQEKIEAIGENTDQEIDYSTLLETLNYYQQHPLNLNTATFEEMMALGLMNDFQVQNLLRHIAKNGKLLRAEELQAINGFDLETIFRILPYVKISPDAGSDIFSLRKSLAAGKHTIMIRFLRVLEEQKGFSPPDKPTDTRYLGSEHKVYTRYRFTAGNRVSVGFTVEKDQGEEFFKGSNKPDHWTEPYKGFDYYSGHVMVRGIGIAKTIVIGDYQIETGQGLALWSGLSFGKSNDVMGIKKNAAGIKPYTSVNENQFMRGVAIALGRKKFTTSLFYSSSHVDGNITLTDTLDQVQAFSSFQESGYHRTPAELLDKNRIGRKITGLHAQYKTRRLDLGATAMYTRFSTELQRSTKPYNQYDFSGRDVTNVSVNYSYLYRNFHLFGETARSDNGGMATLNGVMFSMDPRVSLAVMQRYYARNYIALNASAFSESGSSNEQGIYMGLLAKPARGWTISLYSDMFSYPWLRYLANNPSQGKEYLAQVNYTPNKKTDIYIRYKYTLKQANVTGDPAPIDYLVDKTQFNYRGNVSYKVSASIKLNSRVELSQYQKDVATASKGYLVFQDVTWKKMGSPLSLSARYALFDTDDYDSRIYAYESDVLYAYSIPAYYYRGSRTYVVAKYNIKRGIDVWLRMAQTYYYNRTTIGSGLDEIQGRAKTEVKAQVRFVF